MKIEVTFRGELILLRIIHIDRLFPVQYPMIALRIANNLIQNNLLREKNVTIDEPEGTKHKNDTTYIKVTKEFKFGKKLTKTSSVATYDTNQTHQILRASAAVLDDESSGVRESKK